MYNSELLTYSGVQTRPSHVLTFYMHACTRRRLSFPSGSSGDHSPEDYVNERSAVTFVPEGDSFTPKVLVFELVLLSNRSSASAGRRRYPSLPKVLAPELALLGNRSSPSAGRRRYRSLPKVLVSEGPANELRSISEGGGLTRRSNPQQ